MGKQSLHKVKNPRAVYIHVDMFASILLKLELHLSAWGGNNKWLAAAWEQREGSQDSTVPDSLDK